MPGGLLELVATDEKDVILQRCKRTDNIFSEEYPYHIHSSREVISSDLRKTNSASCYTVTVNRHGDLVSDMYLEVEFACLQLPTDLIDIITSVAIDISGSTQESFTCAWLKILSKQNIAYKPVATRTDNGYKVVYPLPFAMTDIYFPIVSKFMDCREMKVHIEYNEKISSLVLKHQLHITYLYLDTEPRSWFKNNVHSYVIWNKVQREWLLTGTEINQWHKIVLCGPQMRVFDGPTRDLIVVIKEVGIPQYKYSEPVRQLRLRLNGMDREFNYDPLWYRSVNAARFYGVQANEHDHIYYMPFDHTPLAKHATGTLNFGRFNWAKLWIDLKPGNYSITICARVMNKFDFSNDSVSNAWPTSMHENLTV